MRNPCLTLSVWIVEVEPIESCLPRKRRQVTQCRFNEEAAIFQKIKAGQRATFTFASKGNTLFATVHGTLSVDNDRAVIDRLWNRFVAAWFEEGKDDPKLGLLRFDTERAEIWEDEWTLVAGIKLLLGVDPKKNYRDKVAEVAL